MLEVRGITVSYGAIEALTDVSLRVDAGDWVAILGSNGAGKSTLLRTISGLLRPTAGDIFIKDASTLKQSPEAIVRLGVAHVPEGRGILPDLTVRENLLIGAYSRAHRTEMAKDYAGVLRAFPRRSASTSISPGRPSAAANSRCWRSAGRSCHGPTSFSSTKSALALHRS